MRVSSYSVPIVSQKRFNVSAAAGSDRFDAKPSDLSVIPSGIRSRQTCMGFPKIRKSIPAALRCVASESPYGPAPTTATSDEAVTVRSLEKLFKPGLLARSGRAWSIRSRHHRRPESVSDRLFRGGAKQRCLAPRDVVKSAGQERAVGVPQPFLREQRDDVFRRSRGPIPVRCPGERRQQRPWQIAPVIERQVSHLRGARVQFDEIGEATVVLDDEIEADQPRQAECRDDLLHGRGHFAVGDQFHDARRSVVYDTAETGSYPLPLHHAR